MGSMLGSVISETHISVSLGAGSRISLHLKPLLGQGARNIQRHVRCQVQQYFGFQAALDETPGCGDQAHKEQAPRGVAEASRFARR